MHAAGDVRKPTTARSHRHRAHRRRRRSRPPTHGSDLLLHFPWWRRHASIILSTWAPSSRSATSPASRSATAALLLHQRQHLRDLRRLQSRCANGGFMGDTCAEYTRVPPGRRHSSSSPAASPMTRDHRSLLGRLRRPGNRPAPKMSQLQAGPRKTIAGRRRAVGLSAVLAAKALWAEKSSRSPVTSDRAALASSAPTSSRRRRATRAPRRSRRSPAATVFHVVSVARGRGQTVR